MHKLTKISRPDVEGGLRTDSVIGRIEEEPVVGKRLRMIAEPLDKANDIRLIETNIISDINGNIFRTLTGTIYQLEELN
jgi:hypothetical protein